MHYAMKTFEVHYYFTTTFFENFYKVKFDLQLKYQL
jgi:hypothetical protein